MTTLLQCSDYRCTRHNIESFRDDRTWDDRRDGKEPKASLKNILCKVHAGALKRSRYREDPLPLTAEDTARLLKEQAKVDAERRAEAEQRAIEADQRDIVNHREEWASLDKTAQHRLAENVDRSLTAREEPVFEGEVWLTGEEPRYSGDARWLTVEPSHKYYGPAKPGDRLYPYIIRVVRGANLNPTEARELATLLNEAADKAEELNVPRKPA